MSTNQFQFISREIKKNSRYARAIVNNTTALYFCLTMLSSISFLSGYCQPTSPNNRIFDYIPHTDISRLKERQKLSTDYKTSIISASTDNTIEYRLPFYPYMTLNIENKFLPPPPYRIYLGKLSSGKSNDYIFIVTPLIKQKKKQPKYKYVDDTLAAPSLAKGAGPRLYSIRLTINKDTSSNALDTVTYSRITKSQATRYASFFYRYMIKIGLANRFPICLVVDSVKPSVINNKSRIRLQPIIKSWSTSAITKPGSTAGSPGGTKNIPVKRKNSFQFLEQYSLGDADDVSSICCEAPPENGNTIRRRDL